MSSFHADSDCFIAVVYKYRGIPTPIIGICWVKRSQEVRHRHKWRCRTMSEDSLWRLQAYIQAPGRKGHGFGLILVALGALGGG